MDPSDAQQVARFVRDGIDSHAEFALGTVAQDGLPWVVCVGLNHDEQFNI